MPISMSTVFYLITGLIAIATVVMLVWGGGYIFRVAHAENNIVKALKNDLDTDCVRDSLEGTTGAVYALIEKHVADLPKHQQSIIRGYLESGEMFMKLASFVKEAAKKREVNTDTKEWDVTHAPNTEGK